MLAASVLCRAAVLATMHSAGVDTHLIRQPLASQPDRDETAAMAAAEPATARRAAGGLGDSHELPQRETSRGETHAEVTAPTAVT